MANIPRTHYQKITALCFLLNGRQQTEENYKHFRTNYNPFEIEIHNYKGEVRKVAFNSIDILYKRLSVRFDGKTIGLDITVKNDGWSEEYKYSCEDSKKTAEFIFGKGTSAEDVVKYTELALKNLCREYSNEINETIASIGIW